MAAIYDFTLDTIAIVNKTRVTGDRGESLEQRKEELVTLDQFYTELHSDPAGITDVKVDTIIDFTSNATTYINVCTVPAGSKIKLAIIQITELVVGGSTTVKLGLGTHGTSPSLLGKTSALTKNAQNGLVPADAASIIASSTGIDLCGVTTAGSALGDTNVTAGKARVIIVYSKPAVLADV
jgi:hypothetical protein